MARRRSSGDVDRGGVHAQVELRDVKAEGAGAGAKVGEAAVRHPFAPVGAKQRVEIVQIGHELGAVRVPVGAEPLPDLDENRPERLIVVAALGDRADHRRRHPPRCAEGSQLVAVEVTGELPRPLESVLDRLGTDVRVAVEVAADPAPEAERPTRSLEPIAKGPLEVGDRVPEGLLEEPEALADLVDDARPLGADLVRLPEQGDLLRERIFDALPLRGGRAVVVEPREVRRYSTVGLEDGAAGRLGRVRREDELDPQARACLLQRAVLDPAVVELCERLRERLPRDATLGLVFAAAPDAVVLLRDVDELEEERERPQHCGLPVVIERGDRLAELVARASGAGITGESANALLVVEHLLALLLDEHAPEQVAEEAHVGAEGCVGGHAPHPRGHRDRESQS